jgi:BirA family biotin operon repressor/biotin-[acetyl-CoA-carboxylase] ligase
LPAQLDLSATRVEWLASIDSTNDEAMRRAQDGARQALWIAARAQTKGRGRQGRVWQSPPGNLAASLLLIDPAPMALAPQLGFVTGVALAQAMRDLLPVGVSAQMKWPNDLVVGGAKLSGLLLEARQLSDGHMACVIGIGLNVESHPADLPYAATSLRELGCEARAELALERIHAHMSVWISRWQRGENFAAIREAWMGHAAALDGRVEVLTSGVTRTGIFRGLDATGQMILETEAGRDVIAAGDVFLG